MFKSLGGLVSDTIKIAESLVEVPAESARVVTKPVADAAEEATEAVREIRKDITEE